MSRLKQYIIERTMTFELALKVFGISAEEVGDKDALKKKYRNLAIQNHPDRGGSTEKMQDVNDAYAVLAKEEGKQSQRERDEENRVKYRDKYRVAGVAIKTALLGAFDPGVFTRYLYEQSGKQFNHEITKVYPIQKQLEGKYSYPNSAGFTVEFFTQDRNTVFYLEINVDLTQVVFPKAELGNADITWNTYTTTYALHNNKKQKFGQRDWGFTRDHGFFKKPEILFPANKLQKIFNTSASGKKFMKKDMITFIKLKLKGSWDGDFARIPLGDGLDLLLNRQVTMRQGFWYVRGIYKKHNKLSPKLILAAFNEEEQFAIELGRIVDALRRVKGEEAIVRKADELIKRAKDSYEKYKKAGGVV